jgi:hypothetical protein
LRVGHVGVIVYQPLRATRAELYLRREGLETPTRQATHVDKPDEFRIITSPRGRHRLLPLFVAQRGDVEEDMTLKRLACIAVGVTMLVRLPFAPVRGVSSSLTESE